LLSVYYRIFIGYSPPSSHLGPYNLLRKNPSLKKILRSLRLKMIKRMKLMEESNPRLHHMMKLLRMCHLLQWGGL
jgi:hypothetical protein